MSFKDSHLYDFVEIDGVVVPIHYRPLGKKDGALYEKKVQWCDVVINGVPLEETFRCEDNILSLLNSADQGGQGVIIVNSRETKEDFSMVDDYHDGYQEKWMNRLKKMKVAPSTFKQAKVRKVSKDKRNTKPKTEVQKEKSISQITGFKSLVEKDENNIVEKNIFQQQWTGSDGKPYNRAFVPPIDWLIPEKRWDLIWSAMDQHEHGYKRDYIYVRPGEVNNEGIMGPAIYFLNKDNDDINFNWKWNRDFVYGIVEIVDGYISGFNRDVFPFGDEKQWYYTSFKPCVDKPPSRSEYGDELYDFQEGEAETILSIHGDSRLKIIEEESKYN